ncbi:serum amyloid P-component-like [Cheilinus undulatus]|uniref:serum amyloid P-component-like n=1 Tax=Cheilinus undulatus TaxID=241271 RepID=UPI001BD545AD|nr:serum amyloid P-component-like [Cheilinus undulatus]
MEKFVLLMVMFATCWATPQDLTGKVFVFPKQTNTDHVKLLTSKKQFNSVTVCFRFLTDLSREYGLFSLATPSFTNDFLLFKPNSDAMRMHALDAHTDFLSLQYPPNTWHSMCGAWRSDNGLAQLWMDGKPSIKRFIKRGPIRGAPITILGQEQDSYGGTFDVNQSFLGMISQLHMWDYALSHGEIKRYMDNANFTPGNVFNWRALEFEITGDIFVEDMSEVM